MGVLACAEPRGSDEIIRQVSAYRHRGRRAIPSRSIMESKVVPLSRSRAAAPSGPPITQRVSRNTTGRAKGLDAKPLRPSA